MRAPVRALLCGVAAWAAATAAAEPRIVGSFAVPRVPLSAGVSLGGLSDLAVAPGASGAGLRLWTLTDRGPNGTTSAGGARVRTLLAPDFVPALVCLRLDPHSVAGGATAAAERIVPLSGADGRPCSGRPTGGDKLVHHRDHDPLAADANGLDPEALVPLADGTFWIAEEYGPSLVHVSGGGLVLARFTPRGTPVSAAAGAGGDTLPADYARRRENRGFEALAATRDGATLFALLQSPLDNPGRAAGRRTGNVRLLAFDTRGGRPAAEHVYRLGDPDAPGYLTRGAAPDDGKLCAMAALDDERLLVLEQDDGGLARLYVADRRAATDTLPRSASAPALEAVTDLVAAGITPVEKTLAADLTRLRRGMRREADAGGDAGGPLKLEGLAVLDNRHVAIVNDDDFGVSEADAGGPGRGSRVWIVELPEPLAGRGS